MSDAMDTARSPVAERPPDLMGDNAAGRSASLVSAYDATLRAVTAIVGIVVALTFVFGFGNVWTLGLRLGVPGWVAPLVAPAVDLSILGLLLGIRHLALNGATLAELRPARRLLIFASGVTLALNVADPLIAGMVGKAAFDAVGPVLLIAWADVGPGFLQAISAAGTEAARCETGRDGQPPHPSVVTAYAGDSASQPTRVTANGMPRRNRSALRTGSTRLPHDLVERARHEDAAHRAAHQKPISADMLRVRLGVGAERSRRLVAIVRSELQAHITGDPLQDDDTASQLHSAENRTMSPRA